MAAKLKARCMIPPRFRRLLACCLALAAVMGETVAADFARGDLVRLTRRETLQFSGKNFITAAKGGEFAVLKQEGGRVFVEFYKDDGSLIALTLDKESAELSAPATAVTREDPAKRSAAAKALARGRQAVALRRLVAAAKILDEALAAASPATATALQLASLKALRARVTKDLAGADDCLADAERLRTRGTKGVIHALSSLDDGLRLCADHPQLLALKKEMHTQLEERTSPPITPAFLAVAKPRLFKEDLEAARTLYMERCTECHELEMLDSRSLAGWQKTVAGMSRRAGLEGAEQAHILEYLAAALKVVETRRVSAAVLAAAPPFLRLVRFP